MKNSLLVATFIISQIPTLFYSSDVRVDWYLFVDKTQKIGISMYYMVVALNFLILAYCVHFPNGISKKVSKLILIITILDLVHLLFNGKQGFGFAKIAIALIIYGSSNYLHNGSNKSNI